MHRPLYLGATLLVAAAAALAFQPPGRAPLPNFDRRANDPRPAAPADQQNALALLKQRVPNLIVDLDPRTGAPKSVRASTGFLTGPEGKDGGVTAATAAKFGGNEPHRAVKAFVAENIALFGHDVGALKDDEITRQFTTAHNGMKTVVWQQHVDGIPVYEAVFIAHTTRRDELVTLTSQFVPSAAQAADAGKPKNAVKRSEPIMAVATAIANAAVNVGATVAAGDVVPASVATGAQKRQSFSHALLSGETDARLVFLPMSREQLRLCWQVTLTSQQRGEMFRLLVDAETGEVLLRHGLTEYISDATYNIFTSDSPSPFSPGHPSPLSTQPPLVPRTLVTLPALDTNASPSGWIDDGVNETRGNNVDAHLDVISDNIPDSRPQGSPFRVFDFPLNLAQQPGTYTNAAVVQLFYRCNWIHDRLYQLGFTEAAGNFQVNNFGRGGLGNDPVQADAQDGGGFNNANFATPSDGSSGRMQMYLWSGPSPQRDGDFDSEIVIHEYGHGLSNRRVGGGVGLSALQSRGMGEGWSDWYAISLLSESGDDPAGVWAKGGYSTHLLSGQTQNYYFGIRRYPYSTDMSKSPLTFKDIDPTRADPHAGVPRSAIIGNTADAVHNQGEVWCVTLWEARANLIEKYGHEVGNELMLRLVTDGMNLSPPNPTFLQARDGILQASLVYNGGADLGELWAGFAKRGMGYSASCPSSGTTIGVLEAFDIPDSLSVSPAAGFTASGPVGGPFSGGARTFTLLNSAASNITWAASAPAAWLDLSQSAGNIPVGASNIVTVTLSAGASSLPAGIHSHTLRFTNTTTGIAQGRTFVARIGQPEHFTELFDAGDFDLDNQTLTFTPDGTTNFYSACREPATVFPTDPTGGTVLSLGSHTYVALTTPTNISIYGQSANTLYVASEGHITIGSPDTSGSMTLANHFSLPRISASFAHIHPNENGGVVSWRQLSNRVAITFNRVVEYASSNTNSFQLELFYDGRIRLTHLEYLGTYGLVGLSAGNGLPIGFIESDLNGYGPCVLPIAVTVPASATEGDGVLVGQGLVNIFAPAAANMTVTLTSSAPAQATVPANITILAGQSTAAFDITIVDDALLDGVQPVVIAATMPAYAVATDTILVSDNETATLSVSLPVGLTEGDAAPASGVVSASAAPVANIAVTLNSSDTSEIQVPATVILPAGQTSVVFNITVINDTAIDGDQLATVTAQVPNWTLGSANTIVHDNESTNLVVILPPSLREGTGVVANAAFVRISGTLPTNRVVFLSSSDTTELTVPGLAFIGAGQTSAVVQLNVVDDPDTDSSQVVTITASSPGFISGSNTITITDNESPFEPFAPFPPHLATNVIQTSDLFWSSGADAGEIITNDVYFGTNPVPGPGELLGTTTATSWSLPLLAPQTTYYWKIVARKAGVTPGPVWQFTTRGVDHFDWSPISATQYVSQPFAVTVTARDSFGTTVTNFTGPVSLSWLGTPDTPFAPFLSPTNTGVFVNGTWTGNITILQPSSNVVLRVDDGQNHTGLSAAFVVRLQNDIVLSVTDSPDPVSLGGNVTYAITVTNIGPLSATVVTMSNALSVNAVLISVTPSQGTFTTNASNVICSLGTLAANSAATITIVARANGLGTMTNRTTISRAEPDAYLVNNSVIIATTVQSPTIAINDVSLFEGSGSPHTAVFSVRVSPPPALPVTVNFATVNGSAIAPGDFASTNGTLNFAVGETNKTVAVAVVPDTFYEFNESFSVALSAAVNATIADSTGAGTIVNDDAIPSISISDVVMLEGNTGSNNAVFAVNLSAASGLGVFVSYNTISGNATAGTDYLPRSGSFSIPAGTTNTNVVITVLGDLAIESDEVFYVDLLSASDAILLKREAYCLIANDDGLPGQIHRFVWDPLPPVQFMGNPFSATITALDAFDEPATSFAGLATLTGLGPGGMGTNAILGNLSHVDSSSGTYTLGYEFTPDANLTVTHVRSYSGIKVSIWTSTGVLLVAQNVSGPNGAWTETPLATPLSLAAGVAYRIGFYTTGSYYWVNNRPTTFPHGTIVDGFYYTSLDGFPTTFYDGDEVMFLSDLRYTVGSLTTVPIAPTVVGPFVNGVWTGDLTVLAPATNLVLKADDNNGHLGISGAFNVEVRNDLSLSVSDSPDPVSVGGTLNYLLTITNVGPESATAVMVTNVLPATANLVSVTPSRGACSIAGGTITCTLGTFVGNDSATVAVAVTTTGPGAITNRTTVHRGEIDALLGNNAATNVTSVQFPALSVSSSSVVEGHSNSISALFTVLLSIPPASNVFVHVSTLDGSAQAGTDYVPISTTLGFAPGETNLTVPVLVLGDTNLEPNETFSLVLSNPTNAIIAVASGTGTIMNDDAGSTEFQILALTANNSAVVDHNGLTGDDRGGIAASDSRVLYTGDSSTARFALGDLTGGAALGQVFDALVSDLKTGTIYSLANGSAPLSSSGGIVTRLVEHDGLTGLLNGSGITLSSPIPLLGNNGNVGIFAGFGRIMLHSGTNVYDIALPSGIVTNLGPMVAPAHQFTENWAYWGVAENFGGTLYLVCVQNSTTIARTAVPAGPTTVLASFSNLSDMAAFTVSPLLNRWYFHHEGSSQFGGSAETIGYADAVFSYVAVSSPPVILAQPTSRSIALGAPTTFTVSASGSGPLRYQWRRNAGDISGATNASYFIANVQSNHLGAYSVLITNVYGAATSSVAHLTTLPSPLTVLVRSNFVVTLDNASARIYSVQFRSNEIYRVGTFISDWGLQETNNPSSFQRNGNDGTTQLPMTFLGSDGRTASYVGQYAAGGANVALTRNLTLLSRADVLRTTMGFHNDGASTVSLRFFETFDVDYLTNGASYYNTANDRYTISTNGVTLFVGRAIITNTTLTVMLGTDDPLSLIAASSTGYFGILSVNDLNTFFLAGGADSGGAIVDATTDIGKEILLPPGASAGFVFYQSLGDTPAQAELGLINAAGTNAPLRLSASEPSGGRLRLRLDTVDQSPITPYRAAGIQFLSSLDLFPTNWIVLTNPPALTNGTLQINNVSYTNGPFQFFHVREAHD